MKKGWGFAILSLGGLSIVSWSLFQFDIHIHIGDSAAPHVGKTAQPAPDPPGIKAASGSGQPPVGPIEPPPVKRRPIQTIEPVAIGKTQKNELLEVFVESAWTSVSVVSVGRCSFEVPREKKAVFVRFTIRRSPFSRQWSWDEQSALLDLKPLNFLLGDESGRNMEPYCTTEQFYAVSESAHTLGYLAPSDLRRFTFRFQMARLGEPLTFDLSGLE